MPEITHAISSFNSGEWSPRLWGRADLTKFANAARLISNALPMIQGGFFNRPGFEFISEVKDSEEFTRLFGFQFSLEQAYVLEFGDLYTRFYRDRGVLLDTGVPYEIVSPYLSGQLSTIKTAQSADVMFMVQPLVAPQELRRNGDIDWEFAAFDFTDGPYLSVNPTIGDAVPTTMTPAATTGSGIALAASSLVGINNGQGFLVSDVGRWVRLEGSGSWGWAKIDGYVDTLNVTVDIIEAFAGVGATDTWRLGAWSNTTGFPQTLGFHQGRLWFGATNLQPNVAWSSRPDDFDQFSPSEPDGSVDASHGITREVIGSDRGQVDTIQWFFSVEKGLMMGTTASEYIGRPTDGGVPASDDFEFFRQSDHGSAGSVQPLKVDEGIVFLQRAKRRLQEIQFNIGSDQFVGTDLNKLAEHLPAVDISAIAYLKEPYSTVWVTLTDGRLLSCTIKREDEVVGWARHTLGGSACVTGSGGDVTFGPPPPADLAVHVYWGASDEIAKLGSEDNFDTPIWESGPTGVDPGYAPKRMEVVGDLLYMVGGQPGVAYDVLHAINKFTGAEVKAATTQLGPGLSFPDFARDTASGKVWVAMQGSGSFIAARYTENAGDFVLDYTSVSGDFADGDSIEIIGDRVYVATHFAGIRSLFRSYLKDSFDQPTFLASEIVYTDPNIPTAGPTPRAMFSDSRGVVISASYVGVTDGGLQNNLTAYDPSGNLMWAVQIGENGTRAEANIVADSEDPDVIYVPLNTIPSGPNVVKVNRVTGAVLDSTTIPSTPDMFGIAQAGDFLAVTGQIHSAVGASGTGQVSVIDKASFEVMNDPVTGLPLDGATINIGLTQGFCCEIEVIPRPPVVIPPSFLGTEDYCGPQVGSIVTVPSPDESTDQLWTIVKRRDATGVLKQYVEALSDRFELEDEIEDATFLDSFLSYSGTPIELVTNLTHLIGQTVNVLADGYVVEGLVVDEFGQITLPDSASDVHVGLPYLSEVETLQVTPSGTQNDPRGKLKSIHRMFVRMVNTLGGSLNIEDEDGNRELIEDFEFVDDGLVAGDKPIVFNGVRDISVASAVSRDLFIRFEQGKPLPMIVTEVISEMSSSGV